MEKTSVINLIDLAGCEKLGKNVRRMLYKQIIDLFRYGNIKIGGIIIIV